MTWLKRFLTAPVFAEDQEKTRIAGMLNIILWVAFGVSALVAVGIGMAMPEPDPALRATGFLLLALVFLMYLLRHGQVYLTSVLLVGVLVVFSLATSAIFGGVVSASFNIYVLAVIVAGLLLRRRASFIVALLGALAGAGLLYAEMAGFLPAPLTPPQSRPVINLVGMTGAFIAAALLTNLATHSIFQALERARTNAQGLAESNRALQASQSALESRTRDLERRTQQLQIAADVGRAAASIRALDQLLSQVTRLIRERLDVFYAGIFMIDDTGRYAVLQAADNQGEQPLLAAGYRLPLDARSPMGQVIVDREPHIAFDAGTVHAFLPGVQSEITLPLTLGNQLLGMLDIQSLIPNAFALQDIDALRVLADQVAVAISNLRLLQEAEARLVAERGELVETSRRGWEELLHSRAALGYVCDVQGVVRPSIQPWSAQEMGAFQTDGRTVTLPVQVRDQTVAVMRFRRPAEAGDWTPENIALLQTWAEQLGVAMESARLYQDTQRRAAREQVAAQVAARIRESLDMETVLRTAVDEIRQALDLEGVIVQVARPETTRAADEASTHHPAV